MNYYIVTYGCQMNTSDSERIAGLFDSWDWKKAETKEQADFVILNTCSVRESAEHRVYGEINNLAKLKKANPNLIIAVTGCMPGRDKDGALRKKLPDVDLFFPIIDLIRLPEIIMSLRGPRICGGRSNPAGPEETRLLRFARNDMLENYLLLTPIYQSNFQAYIPIQTGCNNYCTYCVVPYSRGREWNRPMPEILKEAQQLADKGYVEITLLGQTVNSYAHFAELLRKLNQIPGIARIHFTAADPQYMTDEIIHALALPRQINYLHLPVQAGSNKILQKMNRKYTREQYLEIIEKIRHVKPTIALGTDIIVGFPGETEKDFEETVDLYKKADFDIAYLAQYSPRSGTAAYKFKDDVPHAEKERRWRVLQHLMEEIVLRKNQKYAGKTVSVLVERCKDGRCSGNSSEMKLVEFPGTADLIGKIVDVKVEKAEMWRLIGNRSPQK